MLRDWTFSRRHMRRIVLIECTGEGESPRDGKCRAIRLFPPQLTRIFDENYSTCDTEKNPVARDFPPGGDSPYRLSTEIEVYNRLVSSLVKF